MFLYILVVMLPLLIPWTPARGGVPSPPPNFDKSWAARNGPWGKAQARKALMAHACGASTRLPDIEEEAPGLEDDDHESLKMNYDDPATATRLAETHGVTTGGQAMRQALQLVRQSVDGLQRRCKEVQGGHCQDEICHQVFQLVRQSFDSLKRRLKVVEERQCQTVRWLERQ